MKLPMLVAVLMGVVTGVFGGVLRDTICNRVPAVFRRNTELYATCSFVGVWVFVGLMRLTHRDALASWTGTAVVVLLRLISVRFRLRLPEPRPRPPAPVTSRTVEEQQEAEAGAVTRVAR